MNTDKSIIHVDLDCFYAQVESVRLGISSDTPLCVQQWNGLIAVNYAARSFGIKRHCTVQEALEKCPHLKLVHVATFANGEKEAKYHDKVSPQTHKVSLDPYRRASKLVFGILQRYGGVLQRASVDEAFVDVTGLFDVNVEIPETLDFRDLGAIVGLNTDEKGTDVNPHSDSCRVKGTAANYRLYLAAKLAQKIREAVFHELKYTCSAGISHNKTLAKLGSGLNKPYQQTVILAECAEKFIATIPISKVPLLGGKFGSSVAEHVGGESVTCGSIAKRSIEELQSMFGATNGAWLYNTCRGRCSDLVTERVVIKGMMSAKSFRPWVGGLDELERWVVVLASELFGRVYETFDELRSWPKTITVHYRVYPELNEKSKSMPFPSRFKITSSDDITRLVCDKIVGDFMLPCSRMSLQLTSFEPVEASANIATAFQNLLPALSKDGKQKCCEKCGNLIAETEWQSHSDWHFALELANEQKKDTSLDKTAVRRPLSNVIKSSATSNSGKRKFQTVESGQSNLLASNFFISAKKPKS